MYNQDKWEFYKDNRGVGDVLLLTDVLLVLQQKVT